MATPNIVPTNRPVKFVATDNSGLPMKRQQVAQACEDCRKKKKRCTHQPGGGIEGGGPGDTSAATSPTLLPSTSVPPTPTIPRKRGRPKGSTKGTTPTMSTTPGRGSVSAPMAMYNSPMSGLGLTSPSRPNPAFPAPQSTGQTSGPPSISSPDGLGGRSQLARNTPSISHLIGEVSEPSLPRRMNGSSSLHPDIPRFVGDSNPEGMFIEATSPDADRPGSRKGDDVGIWLSSGGPPNTSRASSIFDPVLLPLVRKDYLPCLPPESDFDRLRAFYLRNIHPIFPVIPEAALETTSTSPDDIVLKQIVSLAASTSPEMRGHLRLRTHGNEVLPVSTFMHNISAASRAILTTSIISDKITHIRANALLSLYAQPTSPDEGDLPAHFGSRAIHLIQSLGLHLLKEDVGTPDYNELLSLFCAVWALDRLNGAFYGRPCLLHERDIGVNLEEGIRRAPPCFRLFLSIIQWLDKVIDLYRPGPSAEAKGYEKMPFIDLPVLESMIVKAGALKVPSNLLATIESFYHAVIILSCRLPRPDAPVTALSTIPPPSANARRSLAAERIASAVPRDNLSPFPFVPYAISLALSVEYRKMRHTLLPMFRARSTAAFKINCELLRRYADTFWNAKVVCMLGDRVLEEMGRAATALAPHVVDENSVRNSTGHNMVNSANQNTNLASAEGGVRVLGNGTVDFSNIGALSEFDVFGHLDPNFNLDAVDSAMGANLEIGLATNWSNWASWDSFN